MYFYCLLHGDKDGCFKKQTQNMYTAMILILIAMATITETRIVTMNGPMLVDQVQAIADSIFEKQNGHFGNYHLNKPNNDGQTPERIVPGRSNICDSLCPKWCQKVNNTAVNSTHCHYLCGNICYDKMTKMNPFIGNERYEVVPSEFEFSKYDLNGDKLISIDEFASVERVSRAEVADMFIFTDLNGDGIDPKEFQGGPLVFTVQMAAELSAMAMADPPTKPRRTEG